MLKKQPIAVIFEAICAKKLGKGSFKSLDFQCDLCMSQLYIKLYYIKLLGQPIQWRDLQASIYGIL